MGVALAIIIMEQAYQNFNAGKYKEALNNLTANQSNIDSYQPNLYVCEYMSNRCQQSALNCLKKMYELTQRKYKRELNRNDPQTQYNIKLNIAILMILQGKRDSGLAILQEVYDHRNCFIQFIQTRIFLLLIELNIFFKNPLTVLELHRYYLLKPTQSKTNNNNQWISVILHQHGKTFAVSKEEYSFIINIYINQALMQLGAPASSLSSEQEDERLKEELIGKLKKRKNGINKYYETNIVMINRFIQAQKELHNRNYQKCLSLINFVNIVEEYEQMPATKIITNILNAFATSNTGIVHYMYEKPSIALIYFARAKSLLAKACTGVQDKELHLVSLNYGNYIETITYNQALCLLEFKPKESFQYFEIIRKNNQLSKSYKYWYRAAQAVLNYYHTQAKMSQERNTLLNIALSALNNCLLCIAKTAVTTTESLRNIARSTHLLEDDIEPIIMKLKNEVLQFKHSAQTWLCYVSLSLKLYRKAISIGKRALQDKKLSTKNRVNIYFYLIEAESNLTNENQGTKLYLGLIETELKAIKQECVKTLYENKKEQSVNTMDYETLLYFKLFNMSIEERNITDAVKYCELIQAKLPRCLNEFMCDAVKYLHLYLNFDKKYTHPFLKTS